MQRREFFRKGLGLALGGATVPVIPSLFGSPANSTTAATGPAPDLVAVHGGGPSELFDAGIRALGGMKTFVRKGQIVVVKPTIGWNAGPERAIIVPPHEMHETAKIPDSGPAVEAPGAAGEFPF